MMNLMEESKEPLLESGTILYLREHTEHLKKQNQLEERRQMTNIIIYVIILALILGLFFYIHHFNVLNNIVARCVK